jgi:hypothetical protein
VVKYSISNSEIKKSGGAEYNFGEPAKGVACSCGKHFGLGVNQAVDKKRFVHRDHLERARIYKWYEVFQPQLLDRAKADYLRTYEQAHGALTPITPEELTQ